MPDGYFPLEATIPLFLSIKAKIALHSYQAREEMVLDSSFYNIDIEILRQNA